MGKYFILVNFENIVKGAKLRKEAYKLHCYLPHQIGLKLFTNCETQSKAQQNDSDGKIMCHAA